jgi:hypothetical protein
MPWKIHPNGARELVRPSKYEKHLMLYPSGGLSAGAITSLKLNPCQTVKVQSPPKERAFDNTLGLDKND